VQDLRPFAANIEQLFPGSAIRIPAIGPLPTELSCSFARRCILNVRWSSRWSHCWAQASSLPPFSGYYASRASIRDNIVNTELKDDLTFFINYKVYDYNDRFIGAAGVGLTVDAVIKLIDKYQQRYQRSVYFVDNFGRLVLTGAEGGPQGACIGQKLGELDSLTELPNRRGFDLLAAQAMHEARREPKPLTALLLDLDHFKALNDTYGHLAGDQVLIGFARDLESCLRHSDIVCRWGGEEFIVLLKDTDGKTGLMIAEKIRQHVEQQRYAYNDKALQLTVSIGLTTLQADDTLHSLLSRADHAMYRAKQTGRNRTCVEKSHSIYEPV
jgi:diguanylate cyclase (GGDEF)-like protein